MKASAHGMGVSFKNRIGFTILTRFSLLLFLIFVSGSMARAAASPLSSVQTVFLIVMENFNWAQIYQSTDAPYINDSLLPVASFCTQYYNPPSLHPSEPNYLWLESGTNFGVLDDGDPSANHIHSTNHLAFLLRKAGISWRAYEEDIDGKSVPLTATNEFVPRHCPFLYFDDVTGTNDPASAFGIAHIRPYSEFIDGLKSNTVARYNFLTPNLCDDGHDACAPGSNNLAQLDAWLSTEIPRITNSTAYQNNGAIFITWDEGEGGTSDGPIGLIVISKLAKGNGYSNAIHYTHSSTLRTFQEIFNVTPLLGDAANATDLSDLFLPLPPANQIHLALNFITTNTLALIVTGVTPGKTNVLQSSSDFTNWTPFLTNLPLAAAYTNAVTFSSAPGQYYFRLVQLP